MPGVPVRAPQTLSEMMDRLESEIELVKSGSVTDRQAANILGGRKAQLKAADLGLQHRRLRSRGIPEINEEVRLLPGPVPGPAVQSEDPKRQARK